MTVLAQVYQFDGFVVHTSTHGLWKGDTRLSLQEQPFQILLALVEQPGTVVTRDSLRLRLWGHSTFVDFDQSLNSAVRRLRIALGDRSRAPVFIETVPRIGFRFLRPVEQSASDLAYVEAARPRLQGGRTLLPQAL